MVMEGGANKSDEDNIFLYQNENLSYISASARACSFNMYGWLDGSIEAADDTAAGNDGGSGATRIHFVRITARRIIIMNSVVPPNHITVRWSHSSFALAGDHDRSASWTP